MFSKEALVEAVWVDVEGVRFCFVNAILKAHHCERMPSAMPKPRLRSLKNFGIQFLLTIIIIGKALYNAERGL